MRRSNCASLRTTRRVGTTRSCKPRVAAITENWSRIGSMIWLSANVEMSGCLERGVDAFGQRGDIAVELRLLTQRRREQACGIQRLQQIVRGRGEETCLARVRRFGFLLGLLLRAQRVAQLVRALRDALL